MQYRLALSLGSSFLGWSVLETVERQPIRILDAGVRVFSDGREVYSREPLAAGRRAARLMRRNLDRKKLREKRLMNFMIEAGLMPEGAPARKALESIDPWELRARALYEKIPLHHIGRALFHINQRRGFKSIRNSGKADDGTSNMKDAIKDLERKLEATHSRTLGEYLYHRHRQKNPVRARSRVVKGRAEYEFFTARKMYEDEVDAILTAQKQHHPQLTDQVCHELKEIIFYMRPFKPEPPGKCRFEPGEPAARLALPLVQKFRIWQEVNNLEIEDGADGGYVLDLKDRTKIVESLLLTKRNTFNYIRKMLRLADDCRFNLESGRKPGAARR